MSLTVERVGGRHGTARFVDVPWKLHQGRALHWTPPLRAGVRALLDTRRNPFYADADIALFVASRGGRPVGRIAAIENRWHNRHHGDRVGFFGFFDSTDDEEVADGLFEAAAGWLRRRNLEQCRGPMSPSMNHECGMLVEGFDVPAVVMTAWNEPYLPRLVEGCGFAGVQDLLGYYLPGRGRLDVPDRMKRLAERAIERTRVTFREIEPRRLEEEARHIHQLYCEAWAGNWGFVPPSWEEFWHSAKDLKTVLARRYSFVAELDGEVVGVLVVAKDVNRVLRTVPSGRLWPWNVVRLLRRLPSVGNHRIVLLGLKGAFRRRGLFSILAYEAVRRGLESGEEGTEASWILDGNEALNAPLEGFGLEPYKRWRIYQRPLGAG